MATHGVCNPGLVLDEIDKTTAAGSQNGSVSAALLSMVGEERFHDACLMADVDVSRVSYIATANSVEAVDEFLRDRFEVVMVPAPRVEDLPTLHANAVADFMRRNDLDAASVPVLGTAERRALAGQPTTNVEAYQLYLQGRQFFHRHDKRSYAVARHLFERACAIDPDFARAMAAIADCETLGDYVSRELFEDILESEEEHIDWLETQLGLVERLGEGPYLQTKLGD